MSNALDFGLQTPTYLFVKESGGYSNPIKTGIGRLRGIFVGYAEAKSTITVYDVLTPPTPILVNTFAPASGKYYDFGDVIFGTGLWVAFNGIIDCAIIYF
jgi:hypothetical protein